MIPGWGIEITSPSAAAVAIQWYLSGGIAAANCIAAYTPKGAASLAASYDNNAAPGNGLADGTYDAAPGVAPTWGAATGWTFNGSTQYLDSGVVPTNSYSMLVRFSNATLAQDRIICGMRESSNASSFAFWVYSGGSGYFANSNLLTFTPAASGVLGMAAKEAYLDGASEGTIPAGSFSFSGSCYIGGAYTSGGPSWYYQGNIQAFAIYDTTLTAPQVLAVSNAMAAL